MQQPSTSPQFDAFSPDRVPRAFQLFESRAGFAARQVWLRDRMRRADATASLQSRHSETKARAKWALARFNVRAAAFYSLLATIDHQNAFVALLQHFAQVAWYEFTGFRNVFPNERGLSIDGGLTRRQEFWTRAGYKRLAELENPDGAFAGPSSKRRTPVAASMIAEGGGMNRRAQVDAYLKEVLARTGRCIRRTDLWRAAGYQTRTEFERWQRQDPRTTKSACARFARVLVTMERPTTDSQ